MIVQEQKWRATYTPSVTGEVSTVVFSVDRMEDPAGNIVDQAQTRTTDEVNTATVKIDATPPKLKTGTVSFTTADTSNEDDPDLTSTNTLLAKMGRRSTLTSRQKSGSRIQA